MRNAANLCGGGNLAQTSKLRAKQYEVDDATVQAFTPPEGFSSDAGPTAYGLAFAAYSITMSTAQQREVRFVGPQWPSKLHSQEELCGAGQAA